MNLYADVDVALVELLLVTCFEKENPPGNNNLFPSVRLLQSFLLPLVLQKSAKISLVLGNERGEGHTVRSWPP